MSNVRRIPAEYPLVKIPPTEFSVVAAGRKRQGAVEPRAAAAVILRFASMISAFVLLGPSTIPKNNLGNCDEMGRGYGRLGFQAPFCFFLRVQNMVRKHIFA